MIGGDVEREEDEVPMEQDSQQQVIHVLYTYMYTCTQ